MRGACACVAPKNAHTRRAVGRGHLLVDVCARFWTQALVFGNVCSLLDTKAEIEISPRLNLNITSVVTYLLTYLLIYLIW